MSPRIPLDDRYEQRVYAGILGKLIGVYLGRPVEGWPYQDILQRFGQVDRYVNDELGIPLIVADDDISGTLAFGRVVEDSTTAAITAESVGRTWLNYIVEDRTILWWGGYGRSTEHTAYLNLKRGIPAPASGSIGVNGSTLAEQIGAQIFSDAFALMMPGDPDGAAELTRRAAAVSHDGVALDCAAFFAAMRSAAFEESDLHRLVDIGRHQARDARLARLLDDVVPRVSPGDDWHEVRDWIDSRYGYALYPGPCHSLSNTAMALAALLIGGDDFRTAVMVASSVGFDTDSNAGTVGCLNGVRLGLQGLRAVDDLRAPVADRAIVVSADGGESVTDAALETRRILGSARVLRGEPRPPRRPRFDFALPGAVHGFELCRYRASAPTVRARNLNAEGRADALSVLVPSDGEVAVSTVTFLDPAERMTNFSTLASPTLYPGDEVSFRLASTAACTVRPYVLFEDGDAVTVVEGKETRVDGALLLLSWEVPAHGNAVPFRLGLAAAATGHEAELAIHEVDWRGAPRLFQQQGILLSSIWDTRPPGLTPWVSSARNFEADFASTFSVSHPGELGVATTGTREWVDYTVASILTLSLHRTAGLVARARGHRRFVAAVLCEGRVRLIEQQDETRTVLAEAAFPALLDTRYAVELSCIGDRLRLSIDGEPVLAASTWHRKGGGAGFLVEGGTFSADSFVVRDATAL